MKNHLPSVRRRVFLTSALWLAVGAARGQVTLSLGTGSAAPGATATVNLTLNSTVTNGPAGLQWILGYAPGEVSGLAVTSGPAAVAAAKTLSCAPSPGAVRCILYGLTSAVIPNGVVASVQVTLASTPPAGGQAAVQVTGVQATTAGGAPMTTAGVPGAVAVLAPDTQAPTAPGLLTAAAGSGGQINLSWGAATDNTGVTSYRIERCTGVGCTNFAQVATAAGTSYADIGLTPNTRYEYRVRAQDAAGNLGSYSSAAGATTLATISGLVAAYGFEEGAGATAADRSGNGLTGSLQAAAWTTQGRFGNALSFNGTSSAVSVADAAPLDLTTGMTLMAWVYPTANSGWRTVVLKEDTANLAYGLYSGTDASTAGAYFRSGTTTHSATGGAAVPINAWSHVAATYNGSNLVLYLNGQQVGSAAPGGSINATAGPLKIGGNAIWSEWFQGRIDEVRVYNRALSGAEIVSDMNAAVGAPVDTQTPSAPGAPSLTVVSESRIDAAWTAATDNVGVTGYRVERCLGAGCTNFAQVATPATSSFSDNGLAAATTYNYRVRAVDAAGNLGPYSAAVGATTLPFPAVTGLSCSPATVSGGQTSTCTITLNRTAPAGGFPVGLTSGTPGLVSVPASATVPAGSASATFLATASTTATTTPVTITATGGGTASTTVTVSSSPCVFTLSAANRLIPVGGGSAVVSVSTGAGCAWTATTDSPGWIIFQTPSGNGNGSFTFALGPNLGRARMGTVSAGGQSFRVMQNGSTSIVPFNDVLPSSPVFDYVSLMASYSITAGCSVNPPLYCPDNPVTRAQMSVFMVAGLNIAQGTALTYTTTPHFDDVPSTSGYFPFVQRIRDLNITAGCSLTPPLFCPDTSITHGQMAVFMIAAWMKANNLTTFTYTTTPYFTDVPATHPFFRFVQKMRDMGFRNGCSATQYCEGSAVTRGEMSPMIMRAILGAP